LLLQDNVQANGFFQKYVVVYLRHKKDTIIRALKNLIGEYLDSPKKGFEIDASPHLLIGA